MDADKGRPALDDDARGMLLLRLSSGLAIAEHAAARGQYRTLRVEADEVPVKQRLLRALVVRDHYASTVEARLIDLLHALIDGRNAAGEIPAGEEQAAIEGAVLDRQAERIEGAIAAAIAELGKAIAWDDHDRPEVTR